MNAPLNEPHPPRARPRAMLAGLALAIAAIAVHRDATSVTAHVGTRQQARERFLASPSVSTARVHSVWAASVATRPGT
jgi:hypothetical protein